MRSIKRFEQRIEDRAPHWDERVRLGKRSIRSTEILWNKIFESCKGTKCPQYNFNFVNKVRGRSNTAQPPTIIAIKSFSIYFSTFFSITWKLSSKMTSWQHWFNLSERALYFHKILFIYILFLSMVAKDFKLGSTLQLHESRLENAVVDLPPILLIKMELYRGHFAPLHNSKIIR